MNQLVIRGATVVDGLGNEPVRADVAVRDGRISAVGDIPDRGEREVDADGLTLAPGFIDLHTHYDAQITWDRTLSPSPSLGVTTVVMGNCGFGIVPAAPPVRDLILRNLSVVEGMDLDALRAGVRWEFETFGEYMAALRAIAPSANVAVLAGHSVIRTSVMGEAASERAEATPDELAQMKALVAEAMDGGAIGLGASYSLNHSGYGGVPMPSTITDLCEFDALVGAMGERRAGIVQLASGAKTVEEIEAIAGRHGRAVFKGTGAAMYNDQAPERSVEMFEACRAAQARGNPVYIQIPCQPLSFDFTLANAYPFFSHDAFSEAKAFGPEKLIPPFPEPGVSEPIPREPRQPATRPHLPGQLGPGRRRGPRPREERGTHGSDHRRSRGGTRRGPARHDARPRPRGEPRDHLHRPVPQRGRRGRRAAAAARCGSRRPVRRGSAPHLHVRGGLRPALPRPLGAGPR